MKSDDAVESGIRTGWEFRFSVAFALLVLTAAALLLTFGPMVYAWCFPEPSMLLADVVASFNARVADDQIGEHEPPLTVQEVVASIEAQLPSLAASRQVKAIYAKIAQTSRLPEGAMLDPIPGWQLGNGASYTVWWINLNVMTGPTSGYGLRIRETNNPIAKPKDEPALVRPDLSWVRIRQSRTSASTPY